MINYSPNKLLLTFLRDLLDSNEFDKADILSTYFHDDRLNASEVGQLGVAAI